MNRPGQVFRREQRLNVLPLDNRAAAVNADDWRETASRARILETFVGIAFSELMRPCGRLDSSPLVMSHRTNPGKDVEVAA
jgi:hypothetical protein